MLFLAFLHKITPNCDLRDYKTAPFCIITYSFNSLIIVEYVEHIPAIWYDLHTFIYLVCVIASVRVSFNFHFLDVKVMICAFDIDLFPSVWFKHSNEVIYFHVYHNSFNSCYFILNGWCCFNHSPLTSSMTSSWVSHFSRSAFLTLTFTSMLAVLAGVQIFGV